jgi:hypothetical protein
LPHSSQQSKHWCCESSQYWGHGPPSDVLQAFEFAQGPQSYVVPQESVQVAQSNFMSLQHVGSPVQPSPPLLLLPLLLLPPLLLEEEEDELLLELALLPPLELALLPPLELVLLPPLLLALLPLLDPESLPPPSVPPLPLPLLDPPELLLAVPSWRASSVASMPPSSPPPGPRPPPLKPHAATAAKARVPAKT